MEVAELTRLAPAGAAPVEVDAAGSIMLSPIIWKAWSELDRFILGAGLPRYFAESVAPDCAGVCCRGLTDSFNSQILKLKKFLKSPN